MKKEIISRRDTERQLIRQTRLLEANNRIFEEALKCKTDEDFFSSCLSIAEGITGSGFGIIGEINRTGRFNMIALNAPAREARRIDAMNEVVTMKDVEFGGVLGKAIVKEEPIIINDPESHPESIGIPRGHPRITSCLGIPLKHESKAIGMIVLTNKESGYNPDDQKAVETLSVSFVEALMRRRAEEELRKYEKIVSTSNDLLSLVDKNFVYHVVNNTYFQLFKKKREEIIGHSMPEIFGQELFVKKIKPMLYRCLSGERVQYQAWFDLPAGRVCLDTVFHPFFSKKGEIDFFVVCARDITRRKLAEEGLLKKAERLKALYETGKKISSITSKDKLLPWITEEACRLLEADACYFRLRKGDYLVHSGTQKGVKSRFIDRIKIGESISGVIAQEKKPVLIEDNFSDDKRLIPRHREMAKENGFKSYIGVPMITGNEVVGVLNIYSKTAGKLTGKNIGLLSAFADLAAIAIKNAEHIKMTKEAQAQLIRTEKLASVSKLARSVAHEILNPVNIISAKNQIMMLEDSQGEESMKSLQTIKNQIDRIVKISRALTKLSKDRDMTEKKGVDINGIIKDTLISLGKDLISRDIEVEMELKEGLPCITGDEGGLRQVIVNLINNAGDAMPDGGQIKIATGFSEERIRLLISVSDTGVGIPEENMTKIFDPFFTTKREIKEVGLGLTESYGIIEDHGGEIGVENNKDKGTTFFIEIPVEQI